MFMVKDKRNQYLNAEPRMWTNAPQVVMRFVNETSMRGYIKDNHPDIHAGTKLDMVDLDSGKVTEVVI